MLIQIFTAFYVVDNGKVLFLGRPRDNVRVDGQVVKQLPICVAIFLRQKEAEMASEWKPDSDGIGAGDLQDFCRD